MALIDDVKRRLGIYYSDVQKDAEVQQMIDAAAAFSKGRGGIFPLRPLCLQRP